MPPPVAGRERSKLALWSLILSLLFFVPPLGIVGLVLGIVSLVRISKSGGARDGRGLAIAGTLIGAVTTVMVCCIGPAILLPALLQQREQARASTCRGNIKEIGAAVSMYQERYDGQMPPSLQALVDEGDIKEMRVFECPSASYEVAIDPRDVDASGDYYYARVTKPAQLAETGAVPIAWDKQAIHYGHVMVLYSDRHVSSFSRDALLAAVKQHESVYEKPPQLPAAPPDT